MNRRCPRLLVAVLGLSLFAGQMSWAQDVHPITPDHPAEGQLHVPHTSPYNQGHEQHCLHCVAVQLPVAAISVTSVLASRVGIAFVLPVMAQFVWHFKPALRIDRPPKA